MRDIKALGDAIIETVKGYVGKVELALAGRLESLEKRLSELPTPKDGEPGKDGQNGKDAEPVDVAEVIKGVLAVLPVPADGAAGKDGKDGEAGKDGVDGKSITTEEVDALVEARVKSILLDFERRAYDVMQKAVDRLPKPSDGKDGENGKDGLGFDDLTVEHDGERGFTVKFQQGDRVKAFDFTIPIVLDRGVYREGSEYAKGDGCTWGGSYWIAQEKTTSKPDGGDGWRLAVKRGRDGKEGPPGIKGEKGMDGRNGLDGRQL